MYPKFRTALVKTALTLGLAAGTLAVKSTGAMAAAELINCPHSQIRREVTTALPDGWWNTPYVGPVQTTRVIQIAGRTALQCDYGAAGAIQRYAPDGANCTPTTGGFSCTTPGVIAPGVYSTGPLVIPQTYRADLDHGSVGGNGADLWFEAVDSSTYYVVPQNGAVFSISGSMNRGYSGCSTASYSSNRISTRDIPTGTYICVRTNQGRISEFRLNDWQRDGSIWKMHIGYTTWQ